MPIQRPNTMKPAEVESHLRSVFGAGFAPDVRCARSALFGRMATVCERFRGLRAEDVELGEDDFFGPFLPLFAGAIYPIDHIDVGARFELSCNLDDRAQDYMTLLWLYALANHSGLSWMSDAARLTLHTELVTIAVDGA